MLPADLRKDGAQEENGQDSFERLCLYARLDHGLYPVVADGNLLAILHVKVTPTALELQLDMDISKKYRRDLCPNDLEEKTANLGYCSHSTGTTWGAAEIAPDGTIIIKLQGLLWGTKEEKEERNSEFSRDIAKVYLEKGLPRLEYLTTGE